jgi:hypothetical protein
MRTNNIPLKLFLVALGMSLLIIPMFTYAYIYKGFKNPSNSVTVDFGSSSIPGAWVSQLALGTTAWNNVTPSPFAFSAGSSGNDITVANSGTGAALAVTTTTYTGSTISDNDLVFNSSFVWSTSGEAGKYDVRNVATHEFGHFLSLADLTGSSNSAKTMYFQAATGETLKRSLEPDDKNGINFIYP